MTAGQLPSALQQARDGVAGREPHAGQSAHRSGGNGTAVTSRWRNVRVPMRVIRNRAPQLGSGHAISVSVVIQSFAWVRALFRRKDRQERRQRIDGKGLAWREREVLAAHLQPVAGAMTAHHRPIRRHHLDAQIVELERVVTIDHDGSLLRS